MRGGCGSTQGVVVKESVFLEVWAGTEMNGIFLVHPQRYPSPLLQLTEYLWYLPPHENNHRLLLVDSSEKKKEETSNILSKDS